MGAMPKLPTKSGEGMLLQRGRVEGAARYRCHRTTRDMAIELTPVVENDCLIAERDIPSIERPFVILQREPSELKRRSLHRRVAHGFSRGVLESPCYIVS